LEETMVNTLTSKEGTTIAFDEQGGGRALILVDGALSTRSSGSKPSMVSRAGRTPERRAVGRAKGDRQQRLIAYGRSYVRWAVDDPAIARLAFGAAGTEPRTTISPHPHDVLVTELDRLVDAGGLTASARPGADFVI
jgi:hypothetical protein